MTALLIVVYSLCGIYMVYNLTHDLHMLQQNSYRFSRYWRFLQHGDVSSIWRMCDIAMLFIICSNLLEVPVSVVFTGIYCLVKFILISRRKFKKPLVFTNRIKRLYCVGASIFIGLFLWAIFAIGFKPEITWLYSGPIVTLSFFLLMSFFSWVFVVLALFILKPVEKKINNKYIKEAKSILKGHPGLKVIGITGSYGKTSTKHFLHRILSEKYDTLMTPGSYNTPMGVVKTIREMLKPYHSIFICEMGAKQRGDVKEICDIVHPATGIVTAVGPMHLETFKNIENVRNTKFELVDALPSEGLAVINNDFKGCKERTVNNVRCIRYSANLNDKSDKSDFRVIDLNYNSNGTNFKIKDKNQNEYEFNTQLIGEGNISNLLASIIVAFNEGLSYEEIKRGVAGIEPVEHRMSMKKTPGGVTIIDDAFNSNPLGAKMALDALSKFKEGKRIVVTPGMIELGERQHELNFELGETIAKSADIAIIVGEYNRKSLVGGLENNKENKCKIIIVDSFQEAMRELEGFLLSGDVVLYENDLPDSFK